MKEENFEINISDLNKINSFILVDIRNEGAFNYGSIQNAINIPDFKTRIENGDIDKVNQYIIYCEYGNVSKEIAKEANLFGYNVKYIKNGYQAYILEYIRKLEDIIANENKNSGISITKNRSYREKLFSKFCKAIQDFKLIEKGDKIAVCISGGKDSMLMAKLFQEMKKSNMYDFDLIYLVMNPGYNDINLKMIELNAKLLNIPIQIFDSPIFDVVTNLKDSPCYMCARMRRGFLYNKAKELGCNKISLGHHYDDVIETTLMGMLWGGQFQAMVPKIRSTNFENMDLIRPLYYIREKDIINWRDANKLQFIQCACHFTESYFLEENGDKSTSKRKETKQLIKKLKETNPNIEKNIFSSIKNVNLNTLLGYKTNEKEISFNEIYEKNKETNTKRLKENK